VLSCCGITMNLIGQKVILRQWREADLPSLVAMNADLRVMEHFPKPLTPDESRDVMVRERRYIDERGWGLWAVEVDDQFAGFTGLAVPGFQAHFTPCVEIGWRFHQKFWGRGLATEAARLALQFAFSTLTLEEVVSF